MDFGKNYNTVQYWMGGNYLVGLPRLPPAMPCIIQGIPVFSISKNFREAQPPNDKW